MSCLRCELIRAKAIAYSMAGLRRPLQDILFALKSRYGDVYVQKGRRIERVAPGGDLLIYEARR